MSLLDVTAPRYFTDPCFLPEEGRSLAKSAAEAIAQSGTEESVRTLPLELQEIIVDTLRMVAEGQAVTGIPLQTELTPSQAAEFLGTSESFLLGLLGSGRIASRQVDGKPLALLQDVLEYKQERKRNRLETVDELVRDSQRLGLY
jgi:hypothetical protein